MVESQQKTVGYLGQCYQQVALLSSIDIIDSSSLATTESGFRSNNSVKHSGFAWDVKQWATYDAA